MRSLCVSSCLWYVSCNEAETVELCNAYININEVSTEQALRLLRKDVLVGGFTFQQPFDARNVEPSQALDPVPAGDYKVRITASDVEQNKAGTGGFLKLTFEIMEGQYTGRTLFYRLNLWNPNEQAVQIAHKQLSALCHVTGVFNLQNSAQLHSIPFVASVKVTPDGQYNEVKSVKDLNGNAPGKVPASAQAAAPPQPAPAAAPAWGGPAPAAPAATAPPAWGAPAAPPAPPAAAPVQLSPDGKWKLVNGQWLPNDAAPPAPPQPAAAPPAWGAPAAPATAAPAAPGAPPAWTPGSAPAAPPWAK